MANPKPYGLRYKKSSFSPFGYIFYILFISVQARESGAGAGQTVPAGAGGEEHPCRTASGHHTFHIPIFSTN